MKIKNKKIKIELTLDELKIIIYCIEGWEDEYNLSDAEIELLKKLGKIKKENEKNN